MYINQYFDFTFNFGLKIRVSLVQSRVEAPLFKHLQKCGAFLFPLYVFSSANRRPSPTGAKTSVANVKILEAKTHGIVPLVTF